ncbi:MAG: MAC/perforin domain-containing protein [Taibaiella sp.]|jgi:hypothetical protein
MLHRFSQEYIQNHALTKGHDISTVGLQNHGTTDILGRSVDINQYRNNMDSFGAAPIVYEQPTIVNVDNFSENWFIARDETDLAAKVSLSFDVNRFQTQGAAEHQLRFTNSSDRIYEVHIYKSRRVSLTNPTLTDDARSQLERHNRSSYLTENFIQHYGDHYISSVQYGAWCSQEVTQDRSGLSWVVGLLASAFNIFNFNAQAYAAYNTNTNTRFKRISGIVLNQLNGETLSKAFKKAVKEAGDAGCKELLSVTLSPWTTLGIRIDPLPLPTPTLENLPEFNRIYRHAMKLSTNADYNLHPRDINYTDAARELLNFIVDEERLGDLMRDHLNRVFTSPLVFPLAYALRNIPERGIAFISRTGLLHNSIKNIVQWETNPPFLNIVPTLHESNPKKVLMMDWTREGWVRLPCMFDSFPQENAC